jgi:hypothetical protein
MKPSELHRRAVFMGLRLELKGDALAVTPAKQCPAEFAALLRRHKTALLEWLAPDACSRWGMTPPAELPLNPWQPAPSASDRERVIEHLLRQTREVPGPLLHWLVLREDAYFSGPGAAWDCEWFSYAAARDAACWQWQRSEPEVWTILADSEGRKPSAKGRA